MPFYPVDRATNFIVEEESWTVVEYDRTSVPGVIYLSLTETKVNTIYDDIKNNIADLDKLAKYNLYVPSITQIFQLGDHIEPVFTLTKNGKECDAEIVLGTNNKRIIRNIDGELIAVGKGETEISVSLKEHPEIIKFVSVKVGVKEQAEFSGYINGPDTIRLDREATYLLQGTTEIEESVTFSIDDTTYGRITNSYDNQCVIHANAKNKLGKIILTAIYKNQEFKKEIQIIPLW